MYQILSCYSQVNNMPVKYLKTCFLHSTLHKGNKKNLKKSLKKKMMFTQHLIHVKPWRAEDLEKEPPASALLCPNHPAVWQHVLNYTAAAACQNKLFLKKYSLKRRALLHRSLHLFLVFLRKPHSPLVWAPQSSSLSVQRAQNKKLCSPTTCEPLKSGNGSSRRGSQKGRTCKESGEGTAYPGVAGTAQHQQPCCCAAPGTVLLQALGQVDLGMEAAPELLLAMEKCGEYVILDLQYINSWSQVRFIPPPTTKSRV